MPGKPQKPVDKLAFRTPSRERPQVELVSDAPKAIAPPMPKGLHPVARRAWKAFWNSSLAQVVDLAADEEAVRRWAYALSEREELEAEIREHPVVAGSMGQQVANPLIGLLKERIREIEKFREAFGLTPLARMRLGITYSEADEALARMERRRSQHVEPAIIEVEVHDGNRRTS